MKSQTIKLSLVGVMIGFAIAIGVFNFVYAKGYSYLSNEPKNCANCHVMNEQYDGWQKSSHKNVATCNDCHTPPDFIGKYYTKGSNGFWHSYYFTFNNFKEPIEMTERSRNITEAACRKCHENLVETISVSLKADHSDDVSCIRCHRSVGHMH